MEGAGEGCAQGWVDAKHRRVGGGHRGGGGRGGERGDGCEKAVLLPRQDATKTMEKPGIDPGTFRMRSERATTCATSPRVTCMSRG